jgi:hypothetical protein
MIKAILVFNNHGKVRLRVHASLLAHAIIEHAIIQLTCWSEVQRAAMLA